jgi:hypothetical protein
MVPSFDQVSFNKILLEGQMQAEKPKETGEEAIMQEKLEEATKRTKAMYLTMGI